MYASAVPAVVFAYTHIHCCHDYRLTQEDCEFYYPVSKESVQVRFSLINLKSSEGCRANLRKFEKTAHGGFFAGGPVWATAWCPVPPDRPHVQYATVSCHRTMEEEHGGMEVFSGRGLIQIWDCGFLSIDRYRCNTDTYLC